MNKKTIKIAGDTGELRRCPYCGSEDIIGHGVQHNGSHPKRKKCKACGRTFNKQYASASSRDRKKHQEFVRGGYHTI